MMWQPKAALWSPPDLCGVLEKQGRKNGDWKPRYFVLKGSNLFWFASPTARAPKGVVPLEGANVHTVRGSLINESQQQHRSSHPDGKPAIMFGIVTVLDPSYAATSGGRTELVMGASSPELQALWAKAMQAASISRPELLAKLHHKSKLADTLSAEDNRSGRSAPNSEIAASYAPPANGGRETSASGYSTASSFRHRPPCHSSPADQQGQALRALQQQQAAEGRETGLARSLSDAGGLSTYDEPSPSRESFAFPSMGGGADRDRRYVSPSQEGARLSQKNLQQLQRQFEESQIGRPSNRSSYAPSTYTTAVEEDRRRGRARTPPRSNRSPYRSTTPPPRGKTPPRAATHRSATPPPRSRTPPCAPRSDYGPTAHPTHSGPTTAYETSSGPGKDHGKYPLRQMVRNLTDRVVGRITPERRRAATPERMEMNGGYAYGEEGMNPGAATGTVGGRLVHGIMANWADEEEAPRGRTRLHSGGGNHRHTHQRHTPPASPRRPARSPGRSTSPSPRSDYGGASSYYKDGGSMRGHAGQGDERVYGSRPAKPSPPNSVMGLPLHHTTPPSPTQHPTYARSDYARSEHPTYARSERSEPGTPRSYHTQQPLSHAPSVSGASTPTRSAWGGPGSPAGSTLGMPLTHEHLDQLSRQLRSAFTAVGNEGNNNINNGHGPLHSSCGSEAGDYMMSASTGGGSLADAQRQQEELSLVQQQVSMAAQLLRAQADRLQNALGGSGISLNGSPSSSAASQQQQQQQLSRAAPSEITPADAVPSPPASTAAGDGENSSQAGTTPTRRRADTVFFMNHFQALQASLASVAAAAAGAQEQQQKQQHPGAGSVRGSVTQPRPSMQAMQAPLQHYLHSVQQQLAKLKAHRSQMEQSEAAGLNSAMEAVQQALGALHADQGGAKRGGSKGGANAGGSVMSTGAGNGSVSSNRGGGVVPASPQSSPKPPSRLGSVSVEQAAGFRDQGMVGANGALGSVVGGNTSRPPSDAPHEMMGAPPPAPASRAGSIRRAADDLRTQVFNSQRPGSASSAAQLSAQNQVQQQQVLAALQQQQQQGQIAHHSRPTSAMSVASADYRGGGSITPSNTGPPHSRQPSAMSVGSTPAGYTAAAPHSRQPSAMSNMSMASQPGRGGVPASAVMHSRQPSTLGMASQHGNAAVGMNGFNAASRQPSVMSTASVPVDDEPEFGTLPLPELPPHTFSQAPTFNTLSSVTANNGGPAQAGRPTNASKASSASGVGSPYWNAPPFTAPPTGMITGATKAGNGGVPSQGPRTMSTPAATTQQMRTPSSFNGVIADRGTRTQSQPGPVTNPRVAQLQQQPRARYSSTDWC